MKKIKLFIAYIIVSLFIFQFSLIASDLTDDIIYDNYLLLDEESEPLIIYGTKKGSQQITVIDKDFIDKINPRDAADILSKAANVTINRNGGKGTLTSVNIRGLSGVRVLVLINGVPANSGQTGDFDFSMIPVSDIEKIEVIQGGSDTKYAFSGAMGGVINIITRKKRQPGFSVNGGASNTFYYPDFYYTGKGDVLGQKRFSPWYDLFDSQNAYTGVSGTTKYTTTDFSLSLNRNSNHYIYKDIYSVKRRFNSNETVDFSVSGGTRFYLPHFMTLGFSGDYFYADRDISGPVNSSNPGHQSDHRGTGMISFQADKVGSESVYTESMVDYRYSTMSWSDSFGDSKHGIQRIFTVNRWTAELFDWFTLRWGSDLTVNILESTDTGQRVIADGGGYSSLEFNIRDIAHITPFIKVAYDGKNLTAIPKLSFDYSINSMLKIKNNFFRVYRNPAVNDLYWPVTSYAVGNPDLRPEDGIGGDFIVEYNRAKWFYAESSVFVNYIFDTIQWSSNNGIWSPQNVGSALFIGSSNKVKSLFSSYFSIGVNYDFILSYILTDELDIADDKRLPYKPVHTFGFNTSVDWKTGNITLSGLFQSERFTDTLNAGRLNDFFTLDIDINQEIKAFTLYASITNVFNLMYYLIESYPMPNGSITFGLKYSLTAKSKK